MTAFALLWTLAGAAAEKPEAKPTHEMICSATDPFIGQLIKSLHIKRRDNSFERISKLIDWETLHSEAEKGKSPAERTRRLKYVTFWNWLADAHDFGMMCAAPNVFERSVLNALVNKPPFIMVDGEKAETPWLWRQEAIEHLFAERNLPDWAGSLNLLAAEALVTDGDMRGMKALLAERGRERGRTYAFGRSLTCPYSEFATATANVRTELSLPLWADVAINNEDENNRRWAIRAINHIRSDDVIPILNQLLTDTSRDVREDAAQALMFRNRVEASPVLLEMVHRMLEKKDIPSVQLAAPICQKLEEWEIDGVPWERIEAVMHRRNFNNLHVHEVAGICLAAGRKVVALPFLLSVMSEGLDAFEDFARQGQWTCPAWSAAKILSANGHAEGVALIVRYMEIGKGSWGTAVRGLKALTAFVNHPNTKTEDRSKAIDIVDTCLDRHLELFQGYFSDALEQFGQMGALVRVNIIDGKPIP